MNASKILDLLHVPSGATSVLYVVAVIAGVAFLVFASKWFVGWINESTVKPDQQKSDAGKATAGTSAQNVQSQFDKLK